jgi:hypothetical protein
MNEEPQNTEVTPDVEENTNLIGEEEAATLNKKIAAVVGSYFRAVAELSDDDIYRIVSTDEGKNSPRLLDVVNSAYTSMLEVGGDLPRIHFDSFKRAVDSFNLTFKFNIESKLEANVDALLAKVTGKTENPDKMSHQDIIDALSK